jgi:tetratricopeptide (TPR) repeat protein
LTHFHLFILLFFNVFFGTPNFDKAVSLYQLGKYEQAKPLFETCIKENSKDYKSIEYLGDIAGHQKKWEDAIAQYKKLKNAFPQNATYWYKYGGALGMNAKTVNKFKALGMIDEIEFAFVKATQLDNKHIDSRWALVMLYLELPAIIGGSEKKAQKYANELLDISKVDGYLAKGYIDEYFNRYNRAEVQYKKAHEIGNSKTTFQKLYNLYLNKLKDKTKAKKIKDQFDK